MKGSTRQLGSGISTGPSSCGMFAQTVTDHMTEIETPKEIKIQQISTDDPHRSERFLNINESVVGELHIECCENNAGFKGFHCSQPLIVSF